MKITTTKYYIANSGDLKVKKWYNILQKTVLIKKEIVAGNFKLYAHGKAADQFTQEQLEQGAMRVQQELLNSFNIKVPGLLKYRGKGKHPDIELSMRFENDIEIIDNLDDFKRVGIFRKKDDLIIVVDRVRDYEEGAVGLTLDDNIMMIESDDLYPNSNSISASHEFQHQHDGIQSRHDTPVDESHLSGGIKNEYEDKPVNWDNANDIGKKRSPYVGYGLWRKIKKESRKNGS